VYHAFLTVVQLLTSFSFVVATLYMVALFVPYSMDEETSPPFVRLDYVVNAWCRYASFVLIQIQSALTLPQHGSVYMRQYCSHDSACCKIIPLQCSLSDSVLAWRCYVIFGKQRWFKWTLTVVVLGVTGMCCVYLLG
jgi:hypothetical protein